MDSSFDSMQGDSLGLSQGQGRGLAQVFDSTYNPVFKEEAMRNINQQKQEKKEINSQLAEISKNTVWSRDQPLLQEKMNDLYSFTQNNYRNIAKGNSQEALEYKQKIMDVANFAKASKVAEDYFVKLSTTFSSDSSKFDEDETKKLLSGFYAEPGNFNIDQLQLIPAFNAERFNKAVSSNVKALTQKYTYDTGKKDANGNTIYNVDIETVEENIPALAETYWSDSRVQKQFETKENLVEHMKIFTRNQRNQIVKGEPGKTQEQRDEEFDFTITPVSNRQFSQKVGGGGKIGFTPDKTVSLDEIPFNVTMTEPISTARMKELGAIPFNVSKAYQVKKDGDEWDMGVAYEGENIFDKSGEAVLFKPSSVLSIPVFKDSILEGTHTVKVDGKSTTIKDGKVTVTRPNGKTEVIDLKGITLSDNMIKDGKFKGISLSDDLVEFKPFTLGVYEMELGYGQKNFEVLIPFDNFRQLLQATQSNRKQLDFIEKKAADSGALESKSYSEYKRRTGVTNKTNIRIPTFEQVKQRVEATKEWQDRVKEAEKKNQKLEYTKAMYDNFIKTNFNNK